MANGDMWQRVATLYVNTKCVCVCVCVCSRPSDEVIVTPFAQILHSLRSVRYNYLSITGLPSDRSLCQSSSLSPELRSLIMYDGKSRGVETNA